MVVCVAFGCGRAVAARSCAADKEAYVDARGVLRWRGSDEEVALLGVNYYTPFTVDFSQIKKLGEDHRQAIRDDVAHFRRLGLGCVRVHCFDREFSDAKGNLIDNQHVELLDFLVSVCASNGLYTVLTPIAWWGGAYAPGDTQGFSNDFTMPEMTTDPDAWEIQAQFLKQFAGHVNRFTGKRYADDPAVLSFECINEPLYPDDTPDEVVTRYINVLADALRASGTRKPVYYNSWHGRNAAAGAARIDGVTASVYPTGLVAGHALSGSQLLAARGSSLNPDAAIATKSRMIYEFDAADVPGSYMYPSMAKFFRSQSIQVASQFQYDPMILADVNRNWQTHHLNLIYTPGKALSLAIAAEVFRRVPRGVDFGTLPQAAVFPPFRSSDTEDLSEMAAADAFIYSNSTNTEPPSPGQLQRVWGCGSSPCVSYGGSGAYFLDRVTSGVWRLQVYPDIFNVADAYTGTGQRKVCLVPGEHTMRLDLPDLGSAFTVTAFNGSEHAQGVSCDSNGSFIAKPGDYLLIRNGAHPDQSVLHNAAQAAPAYVAPVVNSSPGPLMRARVQPQWKAEEAFALQVDAVFATNVTAKLTSPQGEVKALPMRADQRNPVVFETEIASEFLSAGTWGVGFTASGRDGEIALPDIGERGVAWFLDGGVPLPLLRVSAQPSGDLSVVRGGVDSAEIVSVAGRDRGSRALSLKVGGIGGGSSAAGFVQPFAPDRMPACEPGTGLRVVARSVNHASAFELGFRMRNGQGIGCDIHLSPVWREYLVPFSEMRGLWGLPSVEAFRWESVGQVSVLTGAWLLKGLRTESQQIEIQAVEWVKLRSAWPVTSVGGDMPWSLFDVDEWLRIPLWRKPVRRWRVYDADGGPALHLGVEGFDAALDSVSMRGTCDGATFARLWRTEGADAVIEVRARAASPDTAAFELVFVESGNVAWGTNVPLAPEWRTVRIPVKQLRLFTHWYPDSVKSAGAHLRLSRLEKVNVCFGRWLFPDVAGRPHAVEISAIGIMVEQPLRAPDA